jgi:hypothetical protein
MHGSLQAATRVPERAWVVLVVWAIATPIAAAINFRWE